MSRYTRENGRPSSWYDKGWSPSTNKHQTSNSSYSGRSKRGPRVNPAQYEGRHSHWYEGKAQDSANDTESGATEGQDKNQTLIQKNGKTVPDSKVNAPELMNVTDSVATEKKLWELQRLFSNRKESLSSMYKKNADANTKAYVFKQKTMQALDALAEEYEIFEKTMKKVTYETEEGDMLFAIAYEAMEELDKAQKDRTVCRTRWRPRVNHGSRLQGLHQRRVETCNDLKKACQRTAELKCKATDAHEKTRSHRERCRRATKEHTRSEAAVKHTHALTCEVPDRESNEIKYLREAAELIDEWQKQVQGVPPVSLHTSEHCEVVLTERQR